ncbi:MAG: cytosine deaminase [Spirochaetales bacterium]|nr:cytosine deaminase [Spirochaetales bacterium]MCF7939830.1 cytosine deaminase [Spirochaetales bacterium]
MNSCDLLIRNCRIAGGPKSSSGMSNIIITNGTITAVEAADSPVLPAASRQIDAEGKLAAPPLIDPHLHLDAVLTAGQAGFNESGTLLEGIRIWSERKKTLDAEDIKKRSYRALSWMAAQGTGWVRTHADCSEPSLTAVKALTELRDELAGTIEVQVVAFPQDGIYSHSEGERLMKQAVEMGVDVVGGIPHNELTREDGIKDVEFACSLAKDNGLLVDLHIDETDDDHSRFTESLAAYAYKHGMQGQVTASHATAMHSYNNAYAGKLIGLLQKAGVGVIVNPFDNAILMGRGDSYPKRRGITRVDELLEAGVSVGIGHDSIMDPWYPLGRGSMLEAGSLLLHLAQMSGFRQIYQVFDLLTSESARIMNIEDRYGIEAGNPADLVILNADNEYEALRLRSECLYLIKGGKIISTTEPAASRIEFGPQAGPVDYSPLT